MLVIHRSERADCLVDALGRLLADPLPDPVAAEIVSVPTRGVERWLTQRLSHRLGAGAGEDGVCANLAFPFPATLVERVTSRATGTTPDDDPWRPERCVWPIVELVDSRAGDPELAPLIGHLRAATPPDGRGRPGPVRRLTMARHIADLYDRYAVHRPDLILSWLGDGPAGPGPAADPTEAWQAHLWRLLRDRIGRPGPAERLGQAVAALRAAPDLVDLPERLSVFGLTRLPASHLEVLAAIADSRDVHLFLLHPSAVLWDRTAGVPAPTALPARSEDPTARLPAHPLLRSWARDAREMQLVLAARAITGGVHHPVPAFATAPARLLQVIQSDVRADREPGSSGRSPLDRSDDSLRVYACHGRTRQVEVLRDAILHLLRSDPTLEPRDVVVMCPDIDTFAPLIHAAFGVEPGPAGAYSGGEGEARTGPAQLRVRLADRSLRQTNPLLAVAAALLDLAGSRVTASAVLDLAARPAVSRRFGFDRDDLSTLETWVAGTGIRWGMDAASRSPWDLERLADGTWAAGLDRLLLGVAMADDECRVFAGTVPYDDVPSTAVDLVGRFGEFVSRLGSGLGRLRGLQPVGEWMAALAEAVDSLAECGPDEDWQREQLGRALGEAAGGPGPLVGPDGGPDGSPFGGPVIGLEEVRSLLASQLQGRPTRANFRTGDLTICTLVPMRSVPHRVVALLGLDDGTFPRHPELDGDDLLLRSPRVGDRDARSEDRQLLLDAVLAATEHLIITYSGRDERTNRPRPPCPPLAELLDVVDATFSGPEGGPARDQVVVAHPLQAFDTRNFRSGALGHAGPWSFDPVALGGARAATDQVAGGPWLGAPLDPLDEPVVPLEQLVAFVQHPVRAFLRRRLGLYLSDDDEQPGDALPLDLDPLEKWAVGDRLLEAVISGVDLEQAVVAERRRGFLPPGPVADPVLNDICSDVADLHAAFRGLGVLGNRAESVEVRLELPGGRSIVGTVPGVRGTTVTSCSYSKLGPKHRLAAWVRFLALNADRSEAGFDAVTVGRGVGRDTVGISRLPALPGPGPARREFALERLGRILDLYDRGMRAPLPLPCKSAEAWARGRQRGESDDQLQTKVGYAWRSGDVIPGEQDDPEHVEIWGRYQDESVLLSSPVPSGLTGPGWAGEERSGFAVLARRLWDPLLEHEALAER